jgi:hypothetical protein
MAASQYLYDIKPDDYEKYAEMIMKDLDDFFFEHIQKETNMSKRKKNTAWLLNWIGKDCYQYLMNKEDSPKKKECEDRKSFIKDQYAKKKETKPFLDLNESKTYLFENKNNPDGAFVSRLSSTIPGDLTIQHIEDSDNSEKARRFNYKTQKSSPNQEFIDDYLKNLIEKKNQYIQKNNLQKPLYDKTKVENYYSESTQKRKSPTKKENIFVDQSEEEISFQPYSTGEDISEKNVKGGIYLAPGEFTKREARLSNRAAQKYDRSTLNEQFLKFK